MVALVSGIIPVDQTHSSCLLCSACRFLLIKPKQTECGHRYCTACLENLFKTDNEADCSVCQKKILRSKVYVDRAAENDAFSTKIQCPAYQEGCDWTGSLRSYLCTHRAQCDFHVLPCANVAFGCEAVGPRKKMTAHESRECGWQMELCPRCETFCIHKLLEDHMLMCGKRKEQCPVCGTADLTKADLEQHCDPQHGSCPNVKVPCPFKDVGCQEQPERRDLDAHLRDGQQAHLLQMLSLTTSLQSRKLSQKELSESFKQHTADEVLNPGASDPLKQGTGSKASGSGAASERSRGADPSVLALARTTDGLEKAVCGLNGDLDKYGQVIEVLQQKCLYYEQVLHGLQRKSRTTESPSGHVGSSSPISTNGVLVWKIKDFSSHLMAAKSEQKPSFYSPSFSTHPFGYQLCCRIYPNGDGNGKGSHISLFLAIMKGEYDEVLPWPFKQKVTFMLLDQANQKHIKESFSPDVLSGSFQKPRSHMNIASGCPTFVRHDLFLKPLSHYLKNDTIYIKVVVDPTGVTM
ncbi:TNF receptor-associated factor 2-like isoform X1 [Heptranchias perlo]|uniref:TNF receptor-associated factor 2-like isoform X1 n=1 Tax=Heptranchias perlo TaxID=212740 RepID=UPI00355A8A5C